MNSRVTPTPYWESPYPAFRRPTLGQEAVATSNPQAAQVGVEILRRGGNAVDAAVAMAATLTVTEPNMNGVGGDAFALVWDGERLHGLNASGRAPLGWTAARFSRSDDMPCHGWDSVTVPGAVSGWSALAERFGSLPFEQLLARAIAYAREGFAVMPVSADLWEKAAAEFPDTSEFAEFRRVFLPEGKAPEAGSLYRLPDLAATLEKLAETRGESLYRGELATRIVAASLEQGGVLSREDLALHHAEWVEPLSVPFRDIELFELPPNGQGLVALLALALLEHLPLGSVGPDHPDTVHLQIEAIKLAFADCHAHLGDPAHMRVSASELLSPQRCRALAATIDPERASAVLPTRGRDHGTVYLSAADRQGRMVSFIQSNYLGFGSGIVVPGTGISLHNRGLGYSLDPDKPNRVGPRARPYHTIMPGFVMRAGAPLLSFGVMGGHMQPQGHVQLVVRTAAYGQNPQAAIDAPRFYVGEDGLISLEAGMSPEVAASLSRRGHALKRDPSPVLFGGAQAIERRGSIYCAATDWRKDGVAVAI